MSGETMIRQSWPLPAAQVELTVFGALNASEIARLGSVVEAIESYVARMTVAVVFDPEETR